MERNSKTKEKNQNKATKTLILLDAHAILHRAYHALPAFTSPSGEPTGALYGFASLLFKIMREIKPDYIAACYDLPEPTFRHLAYEKYKAQRPKTEETLISQIIRSKDMARVFKIPVYESAGFEADDVIGTITKQVKSDRDTKIIIASGDLDTLQLVDGDRVVVYTLRKGIQDTVFYDEEATRKRMGFDPKLLPDFKGLRGDPSDNIPGVPGIGEKTATLLIQKYGSLETLYKKLEKEKNSLKKEGVKDRIIGLLEEHKEEAFFSRTLAEIRFDAPVNFSLESATWRNFDKEEAKEMLNKLGFRSLLERIPAKDKNSEEPGQKSDSPLLSEGLDEKNSKLISSASEGDQTWFMDAKNNLCVLVGARDVVILAANDVKNNTTFFNRMFAEKDSLFAFDAKKVFRFLRTFGIEASFAFDFYIAAWLMEPSLSDPSVADIINMFSELRNERAPNTIYDGIAILRKYRDLISDELKKKGLERVFRDLEMPLIPILGKMEDRGIIFDAGYCRELSERYTTRLEELKKDIWQKTGEKFNIDSPKQLSAILFEKLGLNVKGVRKTGKGTRSTRFSELLKLRKEHPIIEMIIEHRELSKLISTYLNVLPSLVAKDGRIHTIFRQTGTVTGRISSLRPNLQNIPVKTAFGQAIRKFFKAPRGFSFAAFDYSQIELRVAAALSKDKKMIGAFKAGQDIHTRTAAEIFNTDMAKVTADMRRKAKIINFGILYGMGKKSLRESAGFSKDEADIFYDEYFNDFQGIKDYIELTKDKAMSRGYVETFFGRRRYIPDINSSYPMVQREAERMAVNAPIQGTAADIMKLAMIKVDKLIEGEWSGKAFIILQIHDELLLEVRDDIIEELSPILKKAMTETTDLGVPLEVNFKKGKSWGDL